MINDIIEVFVISLNRTLMMQYIHAHTYPSAILDPWRTAELTENKLTAHVKCDVLMTNMCTHHGYYSYVPWPWQSCSNEILYN